MLVNAWFWLPVRGRVGITLLALAQLYWVYWLFIHYVRSPITLYFTNVVSTRDETRTIDPAYPEPIDPDVLRRLEESERSLAALGFVDQHRTTDGGAAPLMSVASTLEQPELGDYALILAQRSTLADASDPLTGTISFSAEFTDGFHLSTSNVRATRFWPDAPTLDHVRFPEVTDVAELYRLHRLRVVARRAKATQRMTSRGRTPEQRLVHAKRHTLDLHKHLVRSGYRRRTAGALRPTVRGAICSAWRVVFPWRHVDQWSMRRRARAVERLA